MWGWRTRGEYLCGMVRAQALGPSVTVRHHGHESFDEHALSMGASGWPTPCTQPSFRDSVYEQLVFVPESIENRQDVLDRKSVFIRKISR